VSAPTRRVTRAASSAVGSERSHDTGELLAFSPPPGEASGVRQGSESAPSDRACVSVVVPCLNEAAHIERLLRGVQAQHYRPLEVVVVDGGSTDGTPDIVRNFARQHLELSCTILSAPGATIAAAMNAGIRAARGRIIVRLDAHACPEPDYVARLVHTLRTWGAGVAGGRWEIEPGAPSVVARAIALAVQHPLGAGDAVYRTGRGATRPRPVDTVPFGCFEKATWAEVGGFAEALATNEDYEFNYRVRQTGRTIVLHPGAVSVYVARSTLGALARQYFRYGWWKAEMLKHHPRSLRWRQALPLAFGALVAVLLFGSLVSRLVAMALAATAGVYAGAVLLACAQIAQRGGRGVLRALPLVFPVIHFAWAGGALANLLTLGRWPRWRR
jgi:succinoglycan biosynthesis protein ExoA